MLSALRLWWKLSKNLCSRFPISSISRDVPNWLRPKASCTLNSGKCNLSLKLSPIWGAQGVALLRLWERKSQSWSEMGGKNGCCHRVWLLWVTREVISKFMAKQIWVAIFEGFVALFWDFLDTCLWILVGNYTQSPGIVLIAHKTGIRNSRKYIFLVFLLCFSHGHELLLSFVWSWLSCYSKNSPLSLPSFPPSS